MAVRNTEIMMECNDCLFEGWNEQTAKTHIEMWPDKSEVETHIVRIGHIQFVLVRSLSCKDRPPKTCYGGSATALPAA